MGSRDDSTPHQPLLSSLVVRPSDSGGGGSDYEPGEVRRDPPPYTRADRFSDDPGYRSRDLSVSPVRRREIERRYSPELEDPPRHRGYGGGRENFRSPGRFRDFSPPPPRGRGGRGFGRGGFGGPGYARGRGGQGMHRNTNVRPRDGDWYCPDPVCGNLNFARREYCNNCKRHRYAGGVGSPRRGGYGGGPPPALGPPPRRFPGPPIDRSPPGRFGNGHRSPPPPRGWARDFGPPPATRHEGRFGDHPPMRRDQLDYPEDDFRDRGKFDRPPPPDWVPRDHRRDGFLDRKGGGGYERRPQLSPVASPLSQPLSGRGGRWAEREMRERSRSPPPSISRGGGPPPREFRREPYVERGRDDRRRDRIGNVY